MAFFTYIMASGPHGTLYTGQTDDIARRAWEHREKVQPGFTRKYGVSRLVWYEAHESREAAVIREKQIKAWKRRWKIEMIQSGNPTWRDLYEELYGLPEGQAPLVLDDKPIPEPR